MHQDSSFSHFFVELIQVYLPPQEILNIVFTEVLLTLLPKASYHWLTMFRTRTLQQLASAIVRSNTQPHTTSRLSYASIKRQLRQQSTASAAAAEPFLNGSSSIYIEEMYAAWQQDPNSVHKVGCGIKTVERSGVRYSLPAPLSLTAMIPQSVLVDSKGFLYCNSYCSTIVVLYKSCCFY